MDYEKKVNRHQATHKINKQNIQNGIKVNETKEQYTSFFLNYYERI